MLELDLLLQGFVERGYDELSPEQKGHFEKLLELPDTQLLALLLGNEESVNREVADVIARVRGAIAP